MKLPSEERLGYIKLIAETILVVILVPLVLFAVLSNPRAASQQAVGKRV